MRNVSSAMALGVCVCVCVCVFRSCFPESVINLKTPVLDLCSRLPDRRPSWRVDRINKSECRIPVASRGKGVGMRAAPRYALPSGLAHLQQQITHVGKKG